MAEGKAVALNVERLFEALQYVSRAVTLTRLAAVSTVGLTGAMFVQSWVIEPTLAWYRVQAFLMFIGASFTFALAVQTHRWMAESLRYARVDPAEASEVLDLEVEAGGPKSQG